LANLIDHYSNHDMTRADYMALLRQYTLQQYKNGQPYIAEEYQPDDNYWLVDAPNRSEHYFHSTYNDLIITGLAGLRPREDDIVEINPMLDESIDYLCLENIPYHDYAITVLWDSTNHFGQGTGLRLIVNGMELAQSESISRLTATLPIFGDANLDGLVDEQDLIELATHWNAEATWTGGDFDNDGIVDIDDLLRLARNWDSDLALTDALAAAGLPFATIPEPAALSLTTLMLLAITRRRRGCGTFRATR
jgi:hypothetical protein